MDISAIAASQRTYLSIGKDFTMTTTSNRYLTMSQSTVSLMRLSLRQCLLLSTFVVVQASLLQEASAALPPLSADELSRRAEIIVVGRVQQVSVSTSRTISQSSNWNVEINAMIDQTVKASPNLSIGKTLRIECWALKQRPFGWVGPSGHSNIPAKGARFRMWLTKNQAGNWSPLAPNGIELLDGHSRLDFNHPDAVSPKPTSTFSGISELKFELVSQRGDSEMAIVDDKAEPERFELKITNPSDQPATFRAIALDEDDCHLQLSFRPGTLAIPTRPENDGEFEYVASTNPDGSTTVLIRKQSEWTIKPHAQKILSLANLRFQPDAGTGYSRVEVRLGPGKLGEQSFRDQVTSIPIQIVKHTGKRLVPLRVGFLPSKARSLKIQIVNLLKNEAIELEHSRVEVHLDGEQSVRTAASQKSLNELELVASSAKTSKNFSISKRDPNAHTWLCSCVKSLSLQPSQYLEFELKNFAVLRQDGAMKVRIKFENVRGYRDNEFHLEIPDTARKM